MKIIDNMRTAKGRFEMTNKDFHTNKGYSFAAEDGWHYLVRCHKCGRENWAMAVAGGTCAWCGYDANKDEQFKKSIPS